MDEDEDYVYFGTSLPDIEDEATLKKKAARELQVRDEKGRQRFHGAFTGGFSAGYYNTVGTKEGWAPSSFVSSRAKNAERIQQNPEDFMDDEDFGEFGIATRRIHTTLNFEDKSNVIPQKRKYINTDDVIPGDAPLKDIVQPVRESIGIQILRKLGWRHGQGIGPRVKKQQTGPKVYGCSLFAQDTEKEEDDPTAMLFTFAPQDAESLYYKPKDDVFGLGYEGLSKESVLNARIDPHSLTSTKSFLAKEKKKLTISGQAFGVGAFEEDDDDIYSKDDLSQYDFSDLALKGSEDSQKAIASKKSLKSDDIIEGFCIASKPLKANKHYPAPTVPPSFKPVHLKATSDIKETAKIEKSHHTLSAVDRSLILGEKKFCKQSLNNTSVVPSEIKNQFKKSFTRSTSSPNFRPFPNDLVKQQRYEIYLELKEQGDVKKLVQPASMTEWEKQQEIEEFSKAAMLFKPLANVLSSRFESKSHLSVEHEVMSELEKIKKEKEKKLSVPVKRKLVGIRNRKTFEWHPVSLLCKRMNVPNPYPNDNSSNVQSITKIKPNTVFDHLLFSEEKIASSGEEITSITTSNATNKTEDVTKEKFSPTEHMSSSASKDIPVENIKPPIDFFKDIFENSSSEESDSEKITEKDTPKSPIKDIQNKNSNNSTVLLSRFGNDQEVEEKDLPKDSKFANPPNHKVGFGVFANLDLDALNERKPIQSKNHHSENVETYNDMDSIKSNKDVESSSKAVDEWTPELPPNFKIPQSPTSNDFKVQSRSVGKHKSKHKHKHKHHKHKSSKKKKKKSKQESSSDTEEEYEDIPPILIIEKLKELQKKN